MLTVYCQPESVRAAELVRYGFVRSYTHAQVAQIRTDASTTDSSVYVFVNPGKSEYLLLRELIDHNVKIIILGNLCDDVGELLGIESKAISEEINEWGECSPAPLYGFSESEARIQYHDLPGGLECLIEDRPLLRYDFAEEWNNHGYGAVRTDGSIWSLAALSEIKGKSTRQLARVYKGESELSSYVTLSGIAKAQILWVNRAVGFIDTQEFRLIETFISNYLPESMPCLPLLREVPYGYDAMISMRLDCDESIASAAPLFQLYNSNDIPFSLAIKTAQKTSEDDFRLLNEILQGGGSILSHTVNHKNNWGMNLDDARNEARDSRGWLLEHVRELETLEYAVSPFHQNPDYAVEALVAEHYHGFIGGIVCNDPQYLVSRAGEVYGVQGIVTHSQQCMLHGDCLLKAGNDELSIYKKSARIAIGSGAIFGYLDHPFSERYQYGWESETQRLRIHQDWIDFLQKTGSVLFENEEKMLNHVRTKASANVWLEDDSIRYDHKENDPVYPLAFEYKGSIYRLS